MKKTYKKRFASTIDETIKEISKYDIISFDMFDTLVTRSTIHADENIDLMSFWVAKKFNVDEDMFKKLWFQSVNKLKKSNPNYTIDEVYEQISQKCFFSKTDLMNIKKKQIDNELKICFPRKDMLFVFNWLLKINKTIYIISDMYYSSNVLKKILNKCGYFGFKKIFVSCETKQNKTSRTTWLDFYKSIGNKKSIHIGDNWLADAKSINKLNSNFLLVNSSLTQAKTLKFLKINKNFSIQEKIIYGLILNKQLFNSPFKKFDPILFNSYDLGYSIFGPLFFCFFNYILKQKKFQRLLFVSREGYYLQNIYKQFNKIFSKSKPISNNYLLSSRQVVTLSNIKTTKDIIWICKFNTFSGASKDFFINRFNIKINEYDNVQINKFNQNKKLWKIALKYKNDILKQARLTRERYKKYLKKIVIKNSCIIDVGYSGTAQYFLSNLLNLDISGAYLLINYTKGSKNIKKSKMNMFSPFPTKKYTPSLGCAFGSVVESFLTAPYGQFAGFSSDGEPIYKWDVLSKESFHYRDSLYNGIIDLFKDMKRYSQFNMNDDIINCKTIYLNLKKFYLYLKRHKMSHELNVMLTKYDIFSGFNKLNSITKKYSK